MAINKVIISGNLTRDAELRYTSEGAAVANFCIAMNEKRYDRETGQTVDLPPIFVDCAIWGNRAAKLSPYLTKGLKCFIEGHLKYNTWMKDDEKRHSLSVVVDKFEFAGGGKTDGNADNPAENMQTRGQEAQVADLAQEAADARYTSTQLTQNDSDSYYELYAQDDIPF